MSHPIEQSIKHKLKDISKNLKIPFNTLLEILFLERFLVRIMKSKQALFEKSIQLISYIPEYIFSEKLSAILQLGETNSRMKDFYDCYRLIEENILNKKLLKVAIDKTIENRNIKLKMIPQPTIQLKTRWQSFLKRNKISNLKLSAVISKINQILKR